MTTLLDANVLIALLVADHVHHDARHEFWPDSVSYREVLLQGAVGHRQVTDAYLAQLARTRSGRLATFDQGLATLHHDVAELISST